MKINDQDQPESTKNHVNRFHSSETLQAGIPSTITDQPVLADPALRTQACQQSTLIFEQNILAASQAGAHQDLIALSEQFASQLTWRDQSTKFPDFLPCLKSLPVNTHLNWYMPLLGTLTLPLSGCQKVLQLLPEEDFDIVSTEFPKICLHNLSVFVVAIRRLSDSEAITNEQERWLKKLCSIFAKTLDNVRTPVLVVESCFMALADMLSDDRLSAMALQMLPVSGMITILSSLAVSVHLRWPSDMSCSSLKVRSITLAQRLSQPGTLRRKATHTHESLICELLASGTEESTIKACDFVVVLFQVHQELGISILSLEGFLEELVAEADDSKPIRHRLLMMLSTASIFSSCRVLIGQKCDTMLQECIAEGVHDIHSFVLAVLVFCKLGRLDDSIDIENQQALCNSLLQRISDDSELTENILEALMVLSTNMNLHGYLRDSDLITKILSLSSSTLQLVVYPILVTLYQLVGRMPQSVDTDVSEVVDSLRTYSSVPTPAANHSDARTRLLLNNDLLQLLKRLIGLKRATKNPLLSQILCELSDNLENRTQLAQIGTLPYLIDCNLQSSDTELDRPAARAMARLLISVKPEILFKEKRHSSMFAIAILFRLMTEFNGASPETLESLMALTNIGSMSEEECQLIIGPWMTSFVHSMADDVIVQRASMELTCNLVASEAARPYFLPDGDNPCSNVDTILSSIQNSDLHTQEAATGALASLTVYEAVSRYLLTRPGLVGILRDLVRNGPVSVLHRCSVILINLLGKSDHGGRPASSDVLRELQPDVLSEEIVLRSNSEEVKTTPGLTDVIEELLCLLQSASVRQ